MTRALDLGTGTGMWAVDFGEENPGVEVSSQPQFNPRTRKKQKQGMF